MPLKEKDPKYKDISLGQASRDYVRSLVGAAIPRAASVGLMKKTTKPTLDVMSAAEKNKLMSDIMASVGKDSSGKSLSVEYSGGPAYDPFAHRLHLEPSATSAAGAWHEAGHATISTALPAGLQPVRTGAVVGLFQLASVLPTSTFGYLSSKVRDREAFEREGLVGKIKDTVLANQGKVITALYAPRLLEEVAASVIGGVKGGLGAKGALELLGAFGTYATAAGMDAYNASKGSDAYLANKKIYLDHKNGAKKSASLRLLSLYADDIAELGVSAYRLQQSRKKRDVEDPSQISATGVQYRPHTFLQKKTQDFTGSF